MSLTVSPGEGFIWRQRFRGISSEKLRESFHGAISRGPAPCPGNERKQLLACSCGCQEKLHFPKPGERDPQSHPRSRRHPSVLPPIFRRDKSCELVANSNTQLPLPFLAHPGMELLIPDTVLWFLQHLFSAPAPPCHPSPSAFCVLCSVGYHLVSHPCLLRQHIPSENG